MIRTTLLLVLCASLGLAACEKSQADEATSAESATTSHALTWREDLGPALAHAKVNRKPVVIDFTASWCEPCQRLESETLATEEIADALDGFVRVRQDGSDSTEGIQAAMDRFGVVSFPTLIFIDASGAVVGKTEDFVDVATMSTHLAVARGEANAPVE